MQMVTIAAAVLDVVLAVLVLVAILKLPGLLERIASLAAQQQQAQRETVAALREVLAEIRKVTSQQ